MIIPAYNRPGLVKDAVESVFHQRKNVSEIIVVDDASDIPLKNILTAYLSRIKLITLPENKGVSYARNCGVKASTGNYVAFLDSDDLWLPDKAEEQITFMKDGGYKFSHTGEFWLRMGKWVNQGNKHTKYGGDIFCKILDKCRTSPSSMMFERSFFESLLGFNENLRVCEDYDLALRASAVYEAGYLDEKLIIKRAVSDNSLSASINHIESVRLNILETVINTASLSSEHIACAEKELLRKRGIVKNV